MAASTALVNIQTGTNPSTAVNFNAGNCVLAFTGAFDSGTLTIEISYDDGASFFTLNKINTAANLTVTVPGVHEINVGTCLIRFAIATTAGNAENVNVYVK